MRVNDFSIQVATVNGTGSQSSNNILMRSIFRMGIPSNGKNLFPSNIAGLPTWFTIRVSKDGYLARKKEIDLVVCMNPRTIRKDVEDLPAGSVLVYDTELDGLFTKRDDIVTYPVPFSKLVEEVCDIRKLRKLVVNMIYVGTVAWLLSIDRDALATATKAIFANKPKALEMNHAAVELGWKWAEENLEKTDDLTLEPMNSNEGKLLIEGNTAMGLGCVFGGCSLLTWYPITPSSSLGESFISFAGRLRHDPDSGKATYAVIQAEDELAAVGMAIGGGWAGARAMTTTSGAGISLMNEFIGLAYYAEIPLVIVNVQRMGPSTGLPTRTSQGDLTQVSFVSQGDTQSIMLIPGTVQECFDFGWQAFDIAERFQAPTFIMSDLDLGMNIWTTDEFEYPDQPIDRGKVLSKEDLEKLGGDWGRYRDVDGDGIPYRTIPGTDHPKAGYFTRGSGHDENAEYTEDPDEFQKVLNRLVKKYDTARAVLPQPIIDSVDGAEIGIIACGSSEPAIVECRDQLRELESIQTSYLRLRAMPMAESVKTFIADHDRIYVIDQNRDGQLADLLRLELKGSEDNLKIHSIRHFSGHPLDAQFVTNAIVSAERQGASPVGASAAEESA